MGKLASVNFVHQNVSCLGDLQHMHIPSDFQGSENSGMTQGAGACFLSLSDFNLSVVGPLARSDMDGRNLHFLPPC